MRGPDSARSTGPPRLASKVLRQMLADSDREAVIGELGELYEVQCARRGRASASRWYTRQVLAFAWQLARHGRARGVDSGRSTVRAATGNRERTKGGDVMAGFARELGLALRRLGRARIYTAVSVLTIAVGIGAFTSVIGLVDAVLIEPMPYEEPDELVWVWRDYVEADFPRGWLSGPDIAYMRQQTEVIDGVVAFRSSGLNLAGVDGGEPTQVTAHYASFELFDLLGVRPRLGRGFVAEDGVPEGPLVAVLSHALWATEFGADPGIVGRSVLLDDRLTEVIGVTPEHFRFVRHGSLSDPLEADLYLPLQVDLTADNAFGGSYAGLARLRPGVSETQVEASLAAAVEPVNQQIVDAGGSPIRLWGIALEEDLVAPIRPALLALVGAAAFLLLMLTANLTTLQLGRASIRHREMGVRRALGAGRAHVVSSVAAESVAIAATGAGVGLALAYLGTDLVVALAPETLPRLGAVGMDASVITVAVLTTAVMALGAAVAPSLQSMGVGIGATLKEGGERAGGARTTRLRGALVAAQVALSFMLLVGGGLVARAFSDLLRQDPGFDAASTITFRVPLPGAVYEGPEQAAFHHGLLERIRAMPGVASVGGTTALPLTQVTNQQGVRFPGAPGNGPDERENGPLVDWFRVTPGYFEAAGYRLVAGRDFTMLDADSTTFALVVDDVLADRFFPDGSAVGSVAEMFDLTGTIVGVVDQARHYNVHSDDRGQVYIPYDRFPTAALSYAVRTSVPPESAMPGIRAAARELAASVPIAGVRTLDGIVDDSLGQQRLSLTLILTFALGALLLASLGIYGVVANSVVRRTQEIGVRMALGASAGGVVRLVLGQGLRVFMVGAVLGLVGATLTASVLEGVMVGVRPNDPLVYVGVAIGLLAIAQLASYVPARRATRIDPVDALRS
jgi:predicted permease